MPASRTAHAALLLAVWAMPSACSASPASAWTPVGLSGGGGMFTPAISPADPRVMMLNCDMSAAYISADGGATWRMIHYSQLRSNTRCRPAFHPTDPRTIYAANGWSGLAVSHDQGQTWAPIGQGLPTDLSGPIAIDAANPSRMMVGAGESVYRSIDAGRTWTRCEGPRGSALSIHFDQARPSTVVVGTSQGIWRSDDGGATWIVRTRGLPGGEITSFSGGSNARERITMLYCTTPRRQEGGRWTGGIYRSTDRGDTWESANGAGLNLETQAFDQWAEGPIAQYYWVTANDARPNTVYVFNSNTGIPPPHHASCYRSDDAGRSWRSTFQADPRWQPCNVEPDYTVAVDGQFYQSAPLGVASCPNNPDVLMTVDAGNCFITTDGGKTWRCAHTRRVRDADGAEPRWACNGLVVTTTWNYYIDPFDPRRHYICYTDLGFARSEDAGRTWIWWALKGRAPWRNTCYQLAFDPAIRGKVWGAFSDVHDIPNDNIISGRHRSNGPGGVCISTDSCATWGPSNAGLPAAACTGVVVDPRSPAGARTLYAGFFGAGVYRSSDDGRTWSACNEGLGSAGNRRVCRIALHPDGTLFALVTALRRDGRFTADGVGLFRSRDAGAHWEMINRSKLLWWPKDFTVDPRDSRIVYVGACDANGEEQGGLYRTIDGGATWTRLLRRGPQHFGAYVHPAHPGWIYATLTEDAPGAGLWLSKDDGRTWKPMTGLPFANAQRVAIDPADAGVIYVTTFGGSVWKGPASEE